MIEFKNKLVQKLDKDDKRQLPIVGTFQWRTHDRTGYSSDTINTPIAKISDLKNDTWGRYKYAADYDEWRKIDLLPKVNEYWIIDIETDFRHDLSFEDQFESGECPITVCAFGNVQTGECHQFVADTPEKEKELLTRLAGTFKSFNKLVVAYNAMFDISYIMKRYAVMFGTQMNIASPCLDYMSLYRKYVSNSLRSEKLDAIMKRHLDHGKVAYEGSLYDLYRNDPDKYYEYNLMDVQGIIELERKLNLLELAKRILDITGSVWQDILFNSRLLENYIYNELTSRGLVFRNRERTEEDDDSYEGAVVYTPIGGLYINQIRCYDFRSLYPSIILAYGISPEKKGSEGGGIRSVNGNVYKRSVVGIYEDMSLHFLDGREKAKENKDDLGQQAYKILANSLYGVTGSPFFRLYDRSIAEDITLAAKQLNKYVAYNCDKWIQSGYSDGYIPDTMITHVMGWTRENLIWGHTDSVFIKSEFDLSGFINDVLIPEYVDVHGLRQDRWPLKVKDEYGLIPAILFRKEAKANYYLLKQDGKIKSVGGKYVKSDSIPAAVEFNNDIIDSLLHGFITPEQVSDFCDLGSVDMFDLKNHKPYKFKPWKDYKTTPRCKTGLDLFHELGGHSNDISRGILIELIGPPRSARCKNGEELVLAVPSDCYDQIPHFISILSELGVTFNNDKIFKAIFDTTLEIADELIKPS